MDRALLKTVLYVDDEPDIREVVMSVPEVLGCHSLTSHDGVVPLLHSLPPLVSVHAEVTTA